MDTLQLRDFFLKLNVARTKFIVCAIDELPQRKLKMKKREYDNYAYVINLSKKSEYGTHWVCLFITRSRHGYYVDSYGFKPKSWYLLEFIKKNCSQVTYATQQLQQLHSKVCGMYASCFATHMTYGNTFDTFTGLFSKNLFINDYIVTKLFKYYNRR